MPLFKSFAVRILLTKTICMILYDHLYLKLTKFTRCPSRPGDLGRQPQKAWRFLRDMFTYDLEVVRSSKRCLESLAAQGVREVSVFGERHIIEVLADLAVGSPIRIARIYKQCGDER